MTASNRLLPLPPRPLPPLPLLRRRLLPETFPDQPTTTLLEMVLLPVDEVDLEVDDTLLEVDLEMSSEEMRTRDHETLVLTLLQVPQRVKKVPVVSRRSELVSVTALQRMVWTIG